MSQPAAPDWESVHQIAGRRRSTGRKSRVDAQHFDLEVPLDERARRLWNHRWIQPPQIAYFVSTIDEAGNANIAPVTMGTAMASPDDGWWFAFTVFTDRDTYANLQNVPECVISYYGADLQNQAWITALPIPRGISEIEVAGLTPLASKKVRPFGIKECAANLEARVHSWHRLGEHGRGVMFLCKIVAASVSGEFLKRDNETSERVGVLLIDPLFEVFIDPPGRRAPRESVPRRLYYAKMNRDVLYRDPNDPGPGDDWVGDPDKPSFDRWILDEEKRGRITSDERTEIADLGRRWRKNRDPITNGKVKGLLTEKLQDMVRSRA